GDRQIEARTLFAQVGGREVDDDAAQRPFELRGRDPAADSLLRFLACTIREADDREGGNAALQVSFDLDPPGVEANQGVRESSREHVVRLEDATGSLRASFVTIRPQSGR